MLYQVSSSQIGKEGKIYIFAYFAFAPAIEASRSLLLLRHSYALLSLQLEGAHRSVLLNSLKKIKASRSRFLLRRKKKHNNKSDEILLLLFFSLSYPFNFHNQCLINCTISYHFKTKLVAQLVVW